MIIHPFSGLGQARTFAEMVEGLNLTPNAGDSGHVDDHGRIASIMLDVPNMFVTVFSAKRTSGSWTKFDPMRDTEWVPSTFGEVKNALDRTGLILVSSGDFADGVTDHTSDSEALEGAEITALPTGLIGSAVAASDAHLAVMELLENVGDLLQRVATLEAAQE